MTEAEQVRTRITAGFSVTVPPGMLTDSHRIQSKTPGRNVALLKIDGIKKAHIYDRVQRTRVAFKTITMNMFGIEIRRFITS